MRANELSVYYFAYGHNTLSEDFKERCPSAKFIGPALLHNFQLLIKHYADIVSNDHSSVAGILWSISHNDLIHLDKDEDYHVHYNRIPVEVHAKGKPFSATTYIMDPDYKTMAPPSKDYVRDMITGYREHDLPLEQIKAALDNHVLNSQ
jgi:gamma-glutamylcyclotransferase (GGCT)/AIG2-like uncharacterized protein YtfP